MSWGVTVFGEWINHGMRGLPIEPPPSRWVLPDPAQAEPDDLIAVGGDLEPGTILQGYRKGLFPMHTVDGRLGWWSPWRRGVLPRGGMRVPRSLRKSDRRFDVTIDTAFEEVIDACADPSRPAAWINRDIREAYVSLHRLGWCHSVETRDEAGELVGGLYGVAIGGAFFGESMFHRQRDASKVALLRLVGAFEAAGGMLLDVQWATDHLTSLGAVEIDRREYLHRLAEAIQRPHLSMWFDPAPESST